MSNIVHEIDRKYAAAMERRRRRAIAEIKASVYDEMARHNERMREETRRHVDALDDYRRELETYNKRMENA